MRILLVEPNRINANIYKSALAKSGHKIFVAHQAESAIHLLDKHQVDLVVLELQLGDHNGVEFMYELRSYTEWHNLPIVVHSLVPEYQANLNADAKKSLGIVDYLYKPTTSLEKLVLVLENVTTPTL